jgi:SAM-dependent methyltransferase
VAAREGAWTGLRCAACAVIFLSPRPCADDVAALYRSDDAHVGSEVLGSIPLGTRLRARHVLRAIRRRVGGGDLLEVGAGLGDFLDEARRRRFRVAGIEINPAQADVIRSRGIECESLPLSASSFGGRTFDVIYHGDLLGHLPDPVRDFRLMRERLGPSGLLVFETGNLPDVSEERLGELPTLQYPDHLYFFGERGIRLLLERSGFRLEAVERRAIGPQIAFMRLLGWLRRIAPGTAEGGRAPTPPAPAGRARPAPSAATRWRRSARDVLLHVVRQGVGAIAPQRGRHLALVVFARPA